MWKSERQWGPSKKLGFEQRKLVHTAGKSISSRTGNISQVINYSINNSLAIIDIRIGYEVDINRAETLLEEFLTTLPIGYGGLIAKPTLIGVQDLAVSEIIFRVTAETSLLCNGRLLVNSEKI